MSRVSIFEKKWLDLVFEGKNKEYGAYKLRNESGKTTIKAFLFGIAFVTSTSFCGLFLSSFGNKPVADVPNPTTDSIIKVTKVVYPEKEIKPEEIQTSKPNPSAAQKEPKTFIPLVVETALSQPDVPKNSDIIPTNTPTSPTGIIGGTGIIPTPTNPENKGGGKPIDDNKVKSVNNLDVQPDFPGGINKFRQYVGENFKSPDLEGESTLISVTLTFIIEKDGSMTDIKIAKSAGSEMDKEAIRVLKSLKTKWRAGVLDGQPVRTQYLLPIKIQLNN